jgi:hypothetical protein
MLRRVVEAAPIAVLLAIGIPQPRADAMGVPYLKPDDGTVLVRENERRRSEGSSRGEHRSRDDGRHFRSDDGRRAFREDGRDRREFFRHHRRDDRDRWFGFGRPYLFDDDYGDCGWLRRRAIETGSSYWWRRYRECRGG